jgi:hypothetical protein
VWVVVGLSLACLSLPVLGHWNGRSLRLARTTAAQALLHQLSQAAKGYQLDYAVYPPGEGSGSRDLARALQRPGSKHPYFAVPEREWMLKDGNIANPVDREKVVYYRCPGLHNEKSFDLWCEDGEGKAEGLNNWAK